MSSPVVRQEWEYALGLRRPHFLRPCYWEVPRPQDAELGLPPPDLTCLHFRYIGPGAPDSRTLPADAPTVVRRRGLRELVERLTPYLAREPGAVAGEIESFAEHVERDVPEPTEASGETAEDLAQRDPLCHVVFGGEVDRPATRPFVVTALRAAPACIEVKAAVAECHPPTGDSPPFRREGRRNGDSPNDDPHSATASRAAPSERPYTLTIADGLGDVVARSVRRRAYFPLGADLRFEPRETYTWQVRTTTIPAGESRLVARGIFHLLPEEDLARVAEAEARRAREVADPVSRELALAAVRIEAQLLDEALETLGELRARGLGAEEDLLAGRLEASAYERARRFLEASAAAWRPEQEWLIGRTSETIVEGHEMLLYAGESK
jgi:hypothetical protein